jgi:hypothetical protein
MKSENFKEMVKTTVHITQEEETKIDYLKNEIDPKGLLYELEPHHVKCFEENVLLAFKVPKETGLALLFI